MKASADGTAAGKGREDGWDESVLVWNATVARIPAPDVQQDPARDADTLPDRPSSPTPVRRPRE